jgi:biopolymer transport protein ExbD
MEFKKKSKVSTEIPTASMPDIVFMLLLFFMVSTVFRQVTGLPVNLPVAKKIEKLEAKKNVASIYANVQGEISIDDQLVPVSSIRTIMHRKRMEIPKLRVTLKFDNGEYGTGHRYSGRAQGGRCSGRLLLCQIWRMRGDSR